MFSPRLLVLLLFGLPLYQLCYHLHSPRVHPLASPVAALPLPHRSLRSPPVSPVAVDPLTHTSPLSNPHRDPVQRRAYSQHSHPLWPLASPRMCSLAQRPVQCLPRSPALLTPLLRRERQVLHQPESPQHFCRCTLHLRLHLR